MRRGKSPRGNAVQLRVEEKPTDKAKAFCYSEKCCKNGGLRGRYNCSCRVEKTNAKYSQTWCPDCEHALWWVSPERELDEGEYNGDEYSILGI